MIVGCVKEIKNSEYRVGLTPNNVAEYIKNGHSVYIECDAGLKAGFANEQYQKAGAKVLSSAKEVFDIADMIVKVKEPIAEEYPLLKEKQILFTYLHLASNKKLIDVLLNKKITAIAYETIVGEDGSLPCLKPMSEIAGKLSIIEGAKYLQTHFGGKGILLGSSKVKKGNVLILGAGNAGQAAIKSAVDLGCDVFVVDKNPKKLQKLIIEYPFIKTFDFDRENIRHLLSKADLVVCSVLNPGGETPKIIYKEDLLLMDPGTVIIDISIDQGGCLETSKPTTYEEPIFIENGIVHYCVANMPGAVPHTSTLALTETTIKYGLLIANKGLEKARHISTIQTGINVCDGQITNKEVFKFYYKSQNNNF